MKKFVFILALIPLFSCNQPAANSDSQDNTKPSIDYPDDIQQVFDAHGSLAKWQEMKSLSYDIVKEGGNETQMIDLNNRTERIKTSTFESGYDGENYWTLADSTYNGNPKFYTNLMFYFYAMPFVLADEGIHYEKVDDLTFDGVDYPGYRISYDDGVGVSSKDEYFLHYNADNHEMAWLGYTVTFRSGERSDRVSWIRYNDWKEMNGLMLPNTMSWYNVEDGVIKDLRNSRTFADVNLSDESFDDGILSMPKGAKIFE